MTVGDRDEGGNLHKRRRADGSFMNSVANGYGWPSLVIKALYTFGVPAVIAMFLVYFLSNIVLGQLSVHAVQTESIRLLLQKHMESIDIYDARQEYFLRQLCVNTAKTETTRQMCREK